MEGTAVTTILTADMFSGVADAITGNLAVVIPVGISIFAVIYGIRVAIRFFKGML